MSAMEVDQVLGPPPRQNPKRADGAAVVVVLLVYRYTRRIIPFIRAAGWSSPGPGPCSQPRGPGARGYEKPIFYRTVPVLSKREFAARSVILERAMI